MEEPLRSIARPPEAPSIREVPPDDLGALLRSRVPLIVIESRDEPQVLKALTRACSVGRLWAGAICRCFNGRSRTD